jgi:hypothetical protein
LHLETLLRKEDIKVADKLMEDLNVRYILSQEDYQGVQYKRIIAVLSEKGYIKDVHSHIQTTDYTPLYFDNGGTKAIYRKQRRGKITNAIKFVGIVIAALAGIITIWQFINDVIYSLAHT